MQSLTPIAYNLSSSSREKECLMDVYGLSLKNPNSVHLFLCLVSNSTCCYCTSETSIIQLEVIKSEFTYSILLNMLLHMLWHNPCFVFTL